MFAKASRLTTCTLGGASALAILWSGVAAAQQTNVPPPESASSSDEVIVTAQRRAESAQDVPMAISAFSEKMLDAQRLDGGSELVRAVPNVNFSKGYFAGFNFQIRGVGTQLGTAAGDAGVAVHLNNVPLTSSRFFEAEFYDTERVEVLRGPQGTLYGRNATGGAVNVVTAMPNDAFESAFTAEAGSFDSRRARAMVNIPIADDKLAVRLAGSYLSRSGFGQNTTLGGDVNGRDLWSTRATLLAKPTAAIEATLVWQHFEEDDDRSRTGGQICVKDNGPTSVGGVTVTDPIVRGYMSQGCADASIYAPNSNQAPNSLATIFGNVTQNFGITNGDFFAGKTVSRDLQDTDSQLRPRYEASNDFYQLTVGIDVAPSLKLTSITSYIEDDLYSAREFQGAVPTVPFGNTAFTPGGVFVDPQLGAFNRLATEDLLTQPSEQFSQEFRLDSNFDGRFNFSVGGFYLDYESVLTDFVQANVFTLAATIFNGGVPCALGNPACIYIEPNAEPQALGHNYFTSRSPYQLESRAVFGEAYFDLTDTLKLTVGARYTSDHKEQVILPVRLLAAGSGLQPGPVPQVSIDFNEPTGRVALDWSPDLGFTDETLFYGIVSHGYKAGGTNPPASFTLKEPYNAEFVDSIEFGTKNTLMNGRLRLNLSAFHYDYQDYQVTEIRNRTQEIQNIDAKVKGLEFEGMLEPIDRLVLNAAIGILDTEITRGSFVDTTNFTNRDPTLTLVRGFFASTCAVNTAALATYLATNPTGAAFGNSVCAGLVPGLTPNLNGVPTDLRGNELPNAAKWTVSLGAQYTFILPGAWEATVRGDYYSQGDSFARTYNTVGDELRSYDIVNTTLTFDSPTGDWQAQIFAKNVFDEQPVTNTFVLDQIIGVSRIGFVTDPRIIGANITRRF